jgi:hypothetical protein
MKTKVAALVAATVLTVGSTGHAQDGVFGVLTCQKDANAANQTYIFHSRQPVTCEYEGAGAKRTYQGSSGILIGVDLEYKDQDVMGYLVMGAGKAPDSLVGSYIGAKAAVKLGIGPSAQLGLGGGGNGVMLVPLGLGGGVGLGASIGIAYLDLTKSK